MAGENCFKVGTILLRIVAGIFGCIAFLFVLPFGVESVNAAIRLLCHVLAYCVRACVVLGTIPALILSVSALVFFRQARACGIQFGRSHTASAYIAITATVLWSLLVGFSLWIYRESESSGIQLKNLKKIPEIEEYVPTNFSDAKDFSPVYNDFEIYLRNGGFLKVEDMQEKLAGRQFCLVAVGDFRLEPKLSLEAVSELCGCKMKNLKDVIARYDVLAETVQNLPLEYDLGGKLGLCKEPLQKERLAFRKRDISADLLRQAGVEDVTVEKSFGPWNNGDFYTVKMSDGHIVQFYITAVLPDDIKNDIRCTFWGIRVLDGKELYEASWDMTNSLGMQIDSYRDFFEHYDAFLDCYASGT